MQIPNGECSLVLTAMKTLTVVPYTVPGSGLPSVESAAIATDTPLTGQQCGFLHCRRSAASFFHCVSSGFFRTLHTQFLFGRVFTADEIHNNGNVAIVTENLVRRFGPGENPSGSGSKWEA